MALKPTFAPGSVLTVVLTVIGMLATVGAGRFGYPVILPSMQAGLDLTYAQAGLLTTISAISWLAVVPFTGLLAVGLGSKRVATVATAVSGGAMILLGLAPNYGIAVVAQLIFGAAMGTAMTLFMTIAAVQFTGRARYYATGITTSGGPMSGILVGLTVPLILELGGDAGWRWSWLVLGGLALAVALTCAVFLRAPAAGSSFHGWGEVYRNRSVWHLGLTAAGFTFGFIVFSTFFITFATVERQIAVSQAGQTWALSGFAGLFSGMLAGWFAGRLGRRLTIAGAGFAFGFSLVLLIVGHSILALAVSAFLYGVFGSAMLTIGPGLCAQYVGGRLAPAAAGVFIMLAGVGQAFGAVLAGQLRDLTGSFDLVFLICAIVAAISSISALLLPEPDLASRDPQLAAKAAPIPPAPSVNRTSHP